MSRFFLFAAACLGLTSCLSESTSSCSSTVLEPTLSAVGPKTIAVNQKANFILTYLPESACGQLSSIYEAAGNTANTYLVGPRVTYNDCNCPTTTTTAQATYSFTPATAGTYYLNFVASTPSGFITDTLVAQ